MSIRCAIYTRKSVEEGLEQAYNSLEAQYDACRAYIDSQKHEDWKFSGRYDDGGFSGGNIKRPGFQALLADLEARKIDCIVVYKVDRLSRSLADFTQLMTLFEAKEVRFVSVTQHFNTATSMGKLTLNILLSFAQFEREVTSERIQDKMYASKKRGMWTGGKPPLGYDVVNQKLVINPEEAKSIVFIYERYLELKSLKTLTQDLRERGLHTKSWITQKGKALEGKPWVKSGLARLLQHPVYIGKVLCVKTGEVFQGEHEGIIEEALFNKVQAQFKANRQKENAMIHARPLLQGKLLTLQGEPFKCSGTTKKRGRRYAYYLNGAEWFRQDEVDQLVMDAVCTLDESCPVLSTAFLLKLSASPMSIERIKIMITEVRLTPHKLIITLNQEAMLPEDKKGITVREKPVVQYEVSTDPGMILINVPIRYLRYKEKVRIQGVYEVKKANPLFVNALACGWHERQLLKQGMGLQQIEKSIHQSKNVVQGRLLLTYLAPSIIEALLTGNHSETLNLSMLYRFARRGLSFAEQDMAFQNLGQ